MLSWVSKNIVIDIEAKKILQLNLDSLTNEIIISDYISKWILKKLWNHLIIRFTDQNSSKVWVILSVLDQLFYSSYKNVKKYRVKITKILADLKKLKMSIENMIIMKIMNDLEITFTTYITILNENTQNNKNMSKIDNFFKKLEDKKCQIKQSNTSTINTVNQI